MKIIIRTKGGPTSGNFNHAGRPGMTGGSAPSGGATPYQIYEADRARKRATYTDAGTGDYKPDNYGFVSAGAFPKAQRTELHDMFS